MIKPTFTITSDTNLYSNALKPFKATATSPSDFSTNYYVWDFGDGNTKTGQSIEHVYEKVGEFEVTLTQFLPSGEPVKSDTQTVNVTNLIPNLMDWDENSFNEHSVTASVRNFIPYKVNTFNSWQQYDESSFLNLYVENSNSIPFDITDKRIHLKPNWRFEIKDEDGNFNVIETIKLDQVKIYGYYFGDQIMITPNETDSADSVFIGVSSQSEFYFVDDTPSGIDIDASNFLPSTIIVTQDLSGVYGDKKFTSENYIQYPSLVKSVFVDNIVPDRLYISSNGAFDIDYTKYINTEIPFNIRLVDSSDEGNFIKTNPFDTDSVSPYFMNIGFSEPVQLLDNSVLNEQTLERFKIDFSNLGGFYEGSFTPINTTSESITLTASTKLDYTLNKTLTRYGSFADENSNKIYRVSFIEGFENSYKRKDAEPIEPIIISDNYYSNIFGVAVDGFYNTIFLDSDTSRVEIYDKDFNFTNHYELSSYDEYGISSTGVGNPSPAQVCLNTESDKFITLYDSSDLIYIKNNNVPQKIDLYDQLMGELLLSGGEPVLWDTDSGDFVYTPAAIELLEDNETLYISYASKDYNFVQKYSVTYNNDDTVSLSSLSSDKFYFQNEVIHDMVSTREGDYIYLLAVDYNSRKSYIKVLNTQTDVIDQNLFIGFDAEFITLDIAQNAWAAAKPLINANYTNIVRYDGYSIKIDAFNLNPNQNVVDSDTYIDNLTLSASGNIPESLVLEINGEVFLNESEITLSSTSEFTWEYTGQINIGDLIDIELTNEVGGEYDIEWVLTLNWTDGVTQSYSNGTNYSLLVDRSESNIIVNGIAGDSYGNIWLLDSYNKRVIVFNSSNINEYSSVNIPEDENETSKKYVAYGDWNGFRWYNKFGYGAQVITYDLYGESTPFIINPKNKYNLQKINEDFDMTDTLKSYRTTEPMLNFDNLFDNFLGGIYGNKFDDGTFIGKNFYEKIANFVMNHGDIDTCSIDALESFCKETGIDFKNKIDFPRDIKRIVELFSIRFKKLWGDNYKNIIIEDYIGDYIDSNSYMISADPQVNFIAKEKFNNNLSIITPFMYDDLSSYPLSSYDNAWGWGLSVPEGQLIENYYEFYELKEIDYDRIIDVVDWKNELTNTDIQPLSSYDNYMNENGIVSTILGDKIRDGLGLFINN